jgi:hypothetical protein
LITVLKVRHYRQERSDTDDHFFRLHLFDFELSSGKEKVRVYQGKNDVAEADIGVFEADHANQLYEGLGNCGISAQIRPFASRQGYSGNLLNFSEGHGWGVSVAKEICPQ